MEGGIVTCQQKLCPLKLVLSASHSHPAAMRCKDFRSQFNVSLCVNSLCVTAGFLFQIYSFILLY